MGTLKQLLPLGNKTVVNQCVDTLFAAGIEDIIVVIGGAQGGAVAAALRNAPVTIVRNDSPESDMAESVRVGLGALPARFSGILVSLADHPLIAPDTVAAIIARHHNEPDRIIVPVYQGKRGHPSLFPLAAINEIHSGTTLRDIVRKDHGRVRLLDVPDEGVLLEMDTVDEYQHILRTRKSEESSGS